MTDFFIHLKKVIIINSLMLSAKIIFMHVLNLQYIPYIIVGLLLALLPGFATAPV